MIMIKKCHFFFRFYFWQMQNFNNRIITVILLQLQNYYFYQLTTLY